MIDVERSQPPPPSLVTHTKYDGEDVKTRLLEDFLGKCYLTETVLGRGGFEIDHRRPQAEYRELRFQWENLFPAHPDANRRRSRKWPEHGLLDPAGNDRVEQRIQQWLDGDFEPRFAASAADDLPAVNTAQELDKLHNDRNPKAADLRDAVRTQLCRVQQRLLDYQKAQASPATLPAELLRIEQELRQMFSRRAPYTMLLRSLFQDRADWFD